jgi:hypothetical protein
MALSTRAKFYFGFEITSDNQILIVNILGDDYLVRIPVGYYTLEKIAREIEASLNDLGLLDFGVPVNRATRQITIAADGNFDLLFSQSPLLAGLLGFASADLLGLNSYTGPSAAGYEFVPQFLLLDYVPPEHWRTSVDKTVNLSGSGKVEVVRFGVSNFLEFTIEYQTNNQMPPSSWIETDKSGVENVVFFLEEITKKGEIEFMPDRDKPEEFMNIILESTEEDSQGTSFRLKEMVDRNLVGFYSTGRLKFRKL